MRNLSVNVRLYGLVLFLSLVSVVVGVVGLRGMSDTLKGLQTVYDDRVVPLRDLKMIADMYAVNIVDTSHKVRNGNISWKEARKSLDDAETTIQSKWKSYKATYLVEQEKKLVAEIEPMLQGTQVQLDKLRGILQREDAQAIAEFTKTELYPCIDPISGKFSELIEVQLDVAKDEYEAGRSAYELSRLISLVLLVSGTVLGLAAAMLIVRSVVQPLRQVQELVTSVARSFDYSRRVNISQNDEVGQTAQAFNTLLQAQQNAIAQVNDVVTHLARGQLDHRIATELSGDLAVMKDAINLSMDSVQTTMQRFNGLTAALAAGDFSYRVGHDDIQGEFRQSLGQAMSSMRAMESMIGDIGQVMSAVAQGNLSQRVSVEGNGDLERLKHNINTSLDALAKALQAMHQIARQVATAANQTSTAIGLISDGAQNQTHAISQVATAVRHTSESVSDVSRNTSVASQKSRESMELMRNGMLQMEQMVQVVSSIASNSEKINKITEVIESIANKTNLLSLNAAIEAARAGEHGKGFSVVAEEVGKLAASSAESSQEIARLVHQAVAEAARAVETVRQVSQGMGQIEQGSQETDQMLQRISAALEEQSAAVEEINSNLGSLDQIARSNASASEEMTETVVELSKLADQSRSEVERFTC